MRFVNTNESAELNFSIAKKAYKVDPGGEVEIDAAHVRFVELNGYQLRPAPAKPTKVAKADMPATEPKLEKPKAETPKA